LVGVDEGGALIFGLSAAIGAPESDDETGDVREIAPALESFVYELERRLHDAPGRALFIDYGYLKPEGADTLQALRQHKKLSALEAPGESDLTAHVDFSRLAVLAEGAGLAVHGPVTQGHFLRALGIEMRAETLGNANPGHAERLKRELSRLTDAEQMGTLFKVICISSPNLPTPAGF
jgi:NADH dehydrogenase [ubiquinone] 1 alpha subcomplex assembly factor 7